MDKTIDRWTDPDGNGYAFKDTVARAQNRATIDKMNTETADRKSELDIERKRIDNLIQELPATAGEYQQSKLVLHSYDNTAVKCTTTSGNYTNVPAFTTDQGGPLSYLYTKKSNYQIAVNKSGLYLFELRIHVNSLIANKRVELAPFVNDTRIAALASSYNTAGSFTLTQIAALPLWLSANDTVDFKIAPIDAAEVSLQLGDVLVYAIDWEDKFKIPDYTGYAAETKDIRTGADGTVYGTAGEAVRKQIGNLTEDLGNLSSSKISKFYATNNGENHLADSDDGKIADMMVYGKSEQKSTMGKNLLKLSEVNVHGATNGLLITMNADGSVSVTGTSTSSWSNIIKIDNKCHTDNATYTFSVDKNSDIVVGLKLGRTKLDDANYQTHRIMQNQLSCTFETGASNEYCSLFLEELTVGKSYNFTIYPMLELGTEATAYEPYTGGQPSPSQDYPQEIKSVVNPTIKLSNGDGTESQTVTLPYVLNAIPVNSGGNVTINGQQYVADYVDVERGKLTRMCKEKVFDGTEKWRSELSYMVADIPNFSYVDNNHKHMTYLLCNKYKVSTTIGGNDNLIFIRINGDGVVIKDTLHQSTVDDWKKYLNDNPCIVHCLSAIPEEIDLTTEEIIAFKSLVTCYPTTNISVNSEQLDGYTVFNYPISMQNGWNYVKQQLNDNRDYIYDMDTKTQDIDTQTAEAYVNSEYAVALTELEV